MQKMGKGKIIKIIVIFVFILLVVGGGGIYGFVIGQANNNPVALVINSTIGGMATIGSLLVVILELIKIVWENLSANKNAVTPSPVNTGPILHGKKWKGWMTIVSVIAAPVIIFTACFAYYNDLFVPHTTVVTTTADSGAGSLRDIYLASKSGDAITFADALKGKTILLTSPFKLNKDIKLVGFVNPNKGKANSPYQENEHGENSVTLSYTDAGRIFIQPNVSVIFDHLTISPPTDPDKKNTQNIQKPFIENRGIFVLSHCTVQNNHSVEKGGAISNIGGYLTLNDSFISRNISDNDGGAIYMVGGSLTMNHTTFEKNEAKYNGGGIYNQGGVISITHFSYFRENYAKSDGGGAIENRHGSLLLSGESALEENTATSSGGGILLAGGQAQLDNVKFVHNSAAKQGGGISVEVNNDDGDVAQLTYRKTRFANNFIVRDPNHKSAQMWADASSPSHPPFTQVATLVSAGKPDQKEPIYQPTLRPQYLGNITIDQLDAFCLEQNAGWEKATIDTTAFDIACSNSGTGESKKLIDIQRDDVFTEICQKSFGKQKADTTGKGPNTQGKIIARLANNDNPSSWQCFAQVTELGKISQRYYEKTSHTLLDQYCIDRGYTKSEAFNTTSVYGWRCSGNNKTYESINMLDACQTLFGKEHSFVIDRFSDFNKYNDWQCWGTSK